MKPYGVKIIEHPDVADIQEMGAKSSAGKHSGRSGSTKSYIRNPADKARVRRRWKRRARLEGKNLIHES